MRPTVSQYARSLDELSQNSSSDELSLIAKNFLGLLKRRGEGRKLSAIVKRLETMTAERQGTLVVTVVVAHDVDEGTKQQLSVQAKKIFPQKELELKYVIDKEVIGGAIFRTDETLYDATLLNTLYNFKKSLLKV